MLDHHHVLLVFVGGLLVLKLKVFYQFVEGFDGGSELVDEGFDEGLEVGVEGFAESGLVFGRWGEVG